MDGLDQEKSLRAFLPGFSIRTLFWLITGSAFLFVVVGMAARGSSWAWGVSIATASLLLVAVVHAVWFCIAWIFARILSRHTRDVG